MQRQREQETLSEQRTANELRRLIRKLRWLGMDREAEAMAEELAQLDSADVATVIAQSRETD